MKLDEPFNYVVQLHVTRFTIRYRSLFVKIPRAPTWRIFKQGLLPERGLLEQRL
jgi:hypothetical protein